MANSILVSASDGDGSIQDGGGVTGFDPTRNEQDTPYVSQTKVVSAPVPTPLTGLSSTAMVLLDRSTRQNTKTKYNSVLGKWGKFCSNNNASLVADTVSFVNFVAHDYDRNLKHGTLKGYTAALGQYAKHVDRDVVRS